MCHGILASRKSRPRLYMLAMNLAVLSDSVVVIYYLHSWTRRTVDSVNV